MARMTAKRPSGVFRERLKAVRSARGWSQERLAAEAGMYPTAVAKLEGGQRKDVKLDEAIALAAALNVSPAAMFLPLEDAAEVAVMPDLTVDAQTARRWVIGRRPLDMSTVEAVDAYIDHGFDFVRITPDEAPEDVRRVLVERMKRRMEAMGVGVEQEEG